MVPRNQTMLENREKLIAAARKSFAEHGFAAASMDELTASVGLTRGALYPNFGDKRGLLAAVVAQIDGEMAQRAKAVGAAFEDKWLAMMAEGNAYIKMALEPEVQRIVLRDGPAFLGDPSTWPSQDSCLQGTKQVVAELIEAGTMRDVDVEIAARLLSGAAMNTALWLASCENPEEALPKALTAFEALCSGLKAP